MNVKTLVVLALLLCSSLVLADTTFEASWKLANCHDVTDTAVCSATEVTDSREFRHQVQNGMARVAKQVQGEGLSTFTSVQWTKRAELATNVLSIHFVDDGTGKTVARPGTEVWLDVFADAVAEVATATPTSTDADIEFLITAAWDDIAGVRGRDLQ